MKRFLIYIVAFVMILPLFSVAYAAKTGPGNIQAASYLVMDTRTGQVLLEMNADDRRAPASITKILTCALTLEKGGLDRRVVMMRESVAIPAYSTHIALEAGEDVSVADLLHSTMLLSANDAANGLAQYTGGTLESFVAMMNTQVAALGLENTHFNNAHGLDEPSHYTTARDMAEITRWALGVDGFRELFGALEYDMGATNKKNRNYPFYNQNAMLHPGNTGRYYEGVEGGKLGYTDNAKHTIVSVAKRGELELVCVVLGSGVNTKYTDTAALLDYCFDRFEFLSIPVQNIRDFQVPISDGLNQTGILSVGATEDIAFLAEKGTTLRSLTFQYDVPDYYVEGAAINPRLAIMDRSGTVVASLPLSYTIQESEPIPMTQVLRGAKGVKKTFTVSPQILQILKWVGLVALEFILVLFATRFVVQQYYKNKRKRRRRRHAAR